MNTLRRFWRWFTAVHTDPYDDGYRDLYHEILGRLDEEGQ